MPQPRSVPVSLSDTPWYHVVSRRVRRAYLAASGCRIEAPGWQGCIRSITLP
jgi:hypothetical protein